MKAFGIDLPSLINEVASPMYDDATLVVRKRGTATASNITAGTNPTEENKSCKAIVEDYDERQADGSITRGVRAVVILAASIQDGAVPKPNDKVTVGGVTYRIADGGVQSDAMEGIYVCRVRR